MGKQKIRAKRARASLKAQDIKILETNIEEEKTL